MEGLLFNVDCGYIEGILRGYKDDLLDQNFYSYLTQCESLEDLKLQLSSTQYESKFANTSGPLVASVINEKLTEQFVDQFRYLRSQASGDLAKFMDYLTHGYMINNVILMMTGTLHRREAKDLLQRCHPLGYLKTLPALSVATTVEDIYNLVLAETPLAPYFRDCFSANDLNEMNVEIIRNTLYKAYLEDFFELCQSLNNVTREKMEEILNFEADRRAINITLNSIGTTLSNEDRKKLFPRLGRLYPELTSMLGEAESDEDVRLACQHCKFYSDFFDEYEDGSLTSIDDYFYLKEAELCRLTFLQQVRRNFPFSDTNQ